MAHYTLIARINTGDGKFPFVNVQFMPVRNPVHFLAVNLRIPSPQLFVLLLDSPVQATLVRGAFGATNAGASRSDSIEKKRVGAQVACH